MYEIFKNTFFIEHLQWLLFNQYVYLYEFFASTMTE